MTKSKQEIIDGIIEVEGGYANDPSDSGGETNFGITVAVARAYGYTGPMVDLTRDQAFQIYEDRYWNALRLDDVAVHSSAIAAELADTGINMGTGRAGKFLQQALNVFNQQGTRYPDLAIDGGVGQLTISALIDFLEFRGADGETVLLRALNSLQGAKYIALAEAREKDERFVFGWFLNRVE